MTYRSTTFGPLFDYKTARDVSGFIDKLTETASKLDSGYPKYNIVKYNDSSLHGIELAVAGFSKEELGIKVVRNELIVFSNKTERQDVTYSHKGIAERDFEKRFTLSSDTKVTGSNLVNGILTVYMERIVPEEPSSIDIEIK